MKQLDHPNIVKYFTGWLDKEKQRVIIITELVSGGSLKQNLKSIRSPRLRLLKKWIREILSGLAYLHSKKIIHRDIKCDNIFLDKVSGTLKIGDLGGSAFLYKDYATKYIGTEEFMAPEVHEGKYTVKADIYSLGMAIIEMLTMEKPYKECEGAVNIYEHIKNGIYPEAMGKIENDDVLEFIKLCLKRESERPSANELLENNFLRDLDSKDNDLPVKVGNILRQKNFFSQTSEFKLNDQNYFCSTKQEESKKEKPQLKKSLGLCSKLVYKDSLQNLLNINKPILSPREIGNKKKKHSSFKISIKDLGNDGSPISPSSQRANTQGIRNKSEVEINFIVGKEEWKNKSNFIILTFIVELLKCPYNLEKDTVDGLVNELQKAIDLNEEETKIVKTKLSDSSKYLLYYS